MIILIVGIIILLIIVAVFLFFQSRAHTTTWLKQDIEALRSDLKASFNHLVTQVNERLKDNTSILGDRLDSARTAMDSVKEHLGRLHEASSRIFEVGKDISSLQELLRAPKIRGGVGEFLLEGLLSQVMPSKDFYQLQYRFKSGQQVDAVIRFGPDRLVPIDAEFPLENFKAMLAASGDDEKRMMRKQFINDVKKHISDISSKYILPDEGTFDFALMYIPAENVYYETIIKDERFAEDTGLFQYALSKKVIPVSPNSFYAYLQVILLGLRGMAIEKQTQQIIAALSRLRGDFVKFSEEFEKLGRHIGNSRSCFDDAEKRLNKIQEKILQLGEPQQEKEMLYEKKTTV